MMDFGKSYRHSTIGFYASVSLQFQLDFFFEIERQGKHKVYQYMPEQFSNACFHADIMLCIYMHKRRVNMNNYYIFLDNSFLHI